MSTQVNTRFSFPTASFAIRSKVALFEMPTALAFSALAICASVIFL
uniref:Uncharacterized protein n=1 Tax=Arundo donax TaxID=35708 RepID=A0A0A9FFJ7_ARUDO